MDIQFLLERLEALIVNGRKLPMTSQVVLEQGSALDLIDQMRAAIPEEVRQARRVHQEGDRLIQRAKDEADHIVAAAQEQAALLLQDHELIRRAQSDSAEIVARAEALAEETMGGADKYAADVLRRLESDLETTLSTVRTYIGILEERVGGRVVAADREREVKVEDKRRTAHEAALRGDRNT
ncbi:MAG TPA: ATPase [Candidatus Limnocylindria bacterium]|nr:ATPase [Candidatus Limnocylindria bacterium]